MTTWRVRRLRRALGEHEPARGKRYPIGLKTRLIAFAQKERSGGRSWAKIAVELGLPLETVRRWCMGRAAKSKPAKMRAVEVVPDSAPQTLVAVTESGLRLEGLTIADAVALVRALG
jgi:hypothetical protein